MNKSVRTILITLFLALGAFALLNSMGQSGPALNLGQPKTTSLDYSEFMSRVEKGEIKTAVWTDNRISGETKTGGKYEAKFNNIKPDSTLGASVQEKLVAKGVKVSFPDPWVSPVLMNVLFILGLLVSPFLIFYFMFYRPAQQGGNQAMSFGRSRARRHGENGPKVTFDDVAGIEEAKTELMEIVDFLKNTKKYVALGAKIPKGILLTGPPGVGKTHLARAVAGEAGVPFYHISGSDFVEMFVGVGAARVRDLFETAKAHRPCLIFVDEIDAVGRQRGAGLGGGHDEREQTLNQLLVEMDGFDANQGVIMIAATNRADVLDPALLRPGRFDRQIVVDAPDAKGRELILNIHGKGKPFDTDVDMKTVAKRTPGFTGADLANALNEAALLTARHNKTKISMNEIEESLDRVMVGAARRSRTILDKDREITAYHEAGHAIVGEVLPNCDPVHKVTILPRGMALGLTWSLPDTEKIHVSRSELLDDIAMSLGGLVAEEVVYNERWTGAVSDLDRVTRIARAMVCNYGMSDKLGTLVLGRGTRNPFLGRDFYDEHEYSEEVARMIDEEVRQIIDGQHARAKMLLEGNRDKMDMLVQALLEHETIERRDFLKIMGIDPDNDPKIAKPEPVEAESKSVSGPESSHLAPQPPRLEPGPA